MISDNIILFGCGLFGRQVADELGTKIKIIVDNDRVKWGTVYNNIVIRNPNDLLDCDLEADVLIAVPSQYVSDVKKQLSKMKLRDDRRIFDAHEFFDETHTIPYKQLFKELHSYVDDYKLNNSLKSKLVNYGQMLTNTIHVDGNVAECGVYKGDSALLAAKILKSKGAKKRLHLFDTFEGMPEVNEKIDLHRKGDFSDTSIEYVKERLRSYEDIIQYHKGLFADTLDDVLDSRFSLVHVDCDIYSAVLECCEFFYEKINRNGMMVFDDYGFYSCPGAKKAVDEFFRNKFEKPIYFETGQCIIIKQ